jgi:hypothetical protein
MNPLVIAIVKILSFLSGDDLCMSLKLEFGALN